MHLSVAVLASSVALVSLTSAAHIRKRAASDSPVDCGTLEDGFYSAGKCADKFVGCFAGISWDMVCPADLVFDEKHNACDYPRNVGCSAVGSPLEGAAPTASASTTTTAAPSTEASTTKASEAEETVEGSGHDVGSGDEITIDCTSKPDGFYSVGKCADKFIGCSGGVSWDMMCPAKLVFDESRQLCDYPGVMGCGGPSSGPAARDAKKDDKAAYDLPETTTLLTATTEMDGEKSFHSTTTEQSKTRPSSAPYSAYGIQPTTIEQSKMSDSVRVMTQTPTTEGPKTTVTASVHGYTAPKALDSTSSIAPETTTTKSAYELPETTTLLTGTTEMDGEKSFHSTTSEQSKEAPSTTSGSSYVKTEAPTTTEQPMTTVTASIHGNTTPKSMDVSSAIAPEATTTKSAYELPETTTLLTGTTEMDGEKSFHFTTTEQSKEAASTVSGSSFVKTQTSTTEEPRTTVTASVHGYTTPKSFDSSSSIAPESTTTKEVASTVSGSSYVRTQTPTTETPKTTVTASVYGYTAPKSLDSSSSIAPETTTTEEAPSTVSGSSYVKTEAPTTTEQPMTTVTASIHGNTTPKSFDSSSSIAPETTTTEEAPSTVSGSSYVKATTPSTEEPKTTVTASIHGYTAPKSFDSSSSIAPETTTIKEAPSTMSGSSYVKTEAPTTTEQPMTTVTASIHGNTTPKSLVSSSSVAPKTTISKELDMDELLTKYY